MTELHQMSTLLRRQNDFWQKKMRRRVKMMAFPKLKISQNTEHSPLKACSLLEQSFLVFWFLIWRIRPQFQRILVANPHQTECIALSATRSTNEEASLLLQKTQFLCRILKFPPIQSDQWKNPKVQVFRTFLDTYFNLTIHTFHAAQPKMLICSALFTLCGTSETFPAKSWENTRIFGRYTSLIQFSMQVFSDTCQRLLDAQRRIAQLEDQVNKETEVPRFRWLFWSCHHCSST